MDLTANPVQLLLCNLVTGFRGHLQYCNGSLQSRRSRGEVSIGRDAQPLSWICREIDEDLIEVGTDPHLKGAVEPVGGTRETDDSCRGVFQAAAGAPAGHQSPGAHRDGTDLSDGPAFLLSVDLEDDLDRQGWVARQRPDLSQRDLLHSIDEYQFRMDLEGPVATTDTNGDGSFATNTRGIDDTEAGFNQVTFHRTGWKYRVDEDVCAYDEVVLTICEEIIFTDRLGTNSPGGASWWSRECDGCSSIL